MSKTVIEWEGTRMITRERRQQILKWLQNRPTATVRELAHHFYVSETSIRRDLDALQRQGAVKRIYGGVQLEESPHHLSGLNNRVERQPKAKDIIGRLAADLIGDGQTLAMDASSTLLHMVPHMAGRQGLRTVTNGLATVEALHSHVDGEVYCLGGLFSPALSAFTGAMTCRYLEDFRVDTALFSCKALLADDGLYCMEQDEAALRRVMISQSDRRILLCDSSKLDRSSLFRVCGLDDIHVWVTEKKPDQRWLSCCERCNVAVVYPGAGECRENG